MTGFIQKQYKRQNLSDYEQLELFPNEIFIEIFDYLSLDDLYQLFKGLNQRIDQILQSLNNRTLRLQSNYHGKKQIHINRFFASNAFALNICGKYHFDFKHFPNLRSITYVDATHIQLQYLLQSTFCHEKMNYLNVKSDHLSFLVQYIFSNVFPSLRQYILHSIDNLRTFSWTS
jgi:hypothetical protein